MKDTSNLPQLLLSTIRQAQEGKIFNQSVWQNPIDKVLKNEFLFFIKPEITLPSQTIQLEPIVQLILKKMKEFGFSIHHIRTLSSDYLKQFDLIDQHYQVIAEVSNQGLSAMNTKSRQVFKEMYGENPENVTVLGGVQFLEKYPFFNALSLDCLWQNFENSKLSGGTYVEKIRIDKETIYLLNGFHPKQLLHFYEKGRSIVVFRLSSNLSWKQARQCFVGSTVPSKAEKGSIRHELLDNKNAFGLEEVSQSFNGVHLSAGPVEALVELRRFDSDATMEQHCSSAMDFSFGKKLKDVFGCIPEMLLKNQKIEFNDKKISIFDLTEELDADEALNLIKTSLIKQVNC